MNNDRSLLVGTWALAIILVTAVSFHQTSSLPAPSRIIKTCVVWTILAVISEGSAKLAGMMGIGLLIPLYFVLVQNQPKTSTTASSSLATAAVGAAVI